MIIAIDPGNSGGIVSFQRGQTAAWPMPQTREQAIQLFKNLEAAVSDHGERAAFIEEQSGAGSVRTNPVMMFRFGCAYERMIMVAMLTGWTVTLVSPQKWMKVLNLGTVGTKRAPRGSSEAVKREFALANREAKRAWKIHLRDTARGLYPAQASKITLKNCDALLLLAYARKVTS